MQQQHDGIDTVAMGTHMSRTQSPTHLAIESTVLKKVLLLLVLSGLGRRSTTHMYGQVFVVV